MTHFNFQADFSVSENDVQFEFLTSSFTYLLEWPLSQPCPTPSLHFYKQCCKALWQNVFQHTQSPVAFLYLYVQPMFIASQIKLLNFTTQFKPENIIVLTHVATEIIYANPSTLTSNWVALVQRNIGS